MVNSSELRLVYLFIDGVGLSVPASTNPINKEVCPTLWRLIEKHGKPIDACLGVAGAPQSATGQATMFTGVNCSSAIGRHCEGFPNRALREIVERKNIFTELAKRGKKVRFADAYLVDSSEEIRSARFKSVTTVMALTEPNSISTIGDLTDDRALMQDLTRETAQERYPDIRVISPQRAAEHLFRIASVSDFTLYEFYQTDVAGHALDYDRACSVLRVYDCFLSTLVRFTEAAGITLILTSDHGNIEEMNARGHTLNPVPFVAYGPKGRKIRERVSSLVDVTPAILAAYDEDKGM